MFQHNIENIVIIDDTLLATSYLGEFDAILAKASVSTHFKRLSWEDIDYESNLNIYELNQEIATIARERQLPEKQIVVTPAKVEIVEKKRTPLSAVNIGIQTSSENSNDCMDIIIKKHTKLPVLNAEQIYYGNVAECNDILLKMYVGDSIYATNNHEILSQGLKNIIPTQKCENLQIKVSASLNTVGQLHVVVECLETHKSINLMMTNPSFVYYAD